MEGLGRFTKMDDAMHGMEQLEVTYMQHPLFSKSLFMIILPFVYPKVSGLATWIENCKWYSSLELGAVVSLFCVSV
jgi:hypothetical protein